MLTDYADILPPDEQRRLARERKAKFFPHNGRVPAPPRKVEEAVAEVVPITPPPARPSYADLVHTVPWRWVPRPSYDLTPIGLAEALSTPVRAPDTLMIVGLSKKILDEVAYSFGVSVRDLEGTRRFTQIANARQCAMWLLRVVGSKSFMQIGYILKKDHSTAIHACQKIERAVNEESDLGAHAHRLMVRLVELRSIGHFEQKLVKAFVLPVEKCGRSDDPLPAATPPAVEMERPARCFEHRAGQKD